MIEYCLILEQDTFTPSENPCIPTPCGPNSQCRDVKGQAICSCVPGYFGIPPSCRPECVISSECSLTNACVNQRCEDPCPGACGTNAICHVNNHSPICACKEGFTGNAFVSCYPIVVSKRKTVLFLMKHTIDVLMITNYLFWL